jgi:regulation of enolase protein 1 (concanavalin A-like superfamily)
MTAFSSRRMPWEAGTWTTPPVRVEHDGAHLVVHAREGSDYWRDTLYGFRHDNGHALLAPWEAAVAVEVSFQLTGFDGLYDQAGLMLWRAPDAWLKAGIEVNDGVPHLAVVVTHARSDWSLAPVPEWSGQEVSVRASRMRDAVILRARAAAAPWRTARVAHFPHVASVQAGPLVCAPLRSGLAVTLTRWAWTAPDTDLHAAPPSDGLA